MSHRRSTQPVEECLRPTCPTCDRLYDQPPAPSNPQKPTGLFAPGDVRGATDHREADKMRHAAHKLGLRHWYQLTNFLPCAFPDKTPHKRGYVVETLCGRVVNIGHVCGAHNILGLDEVIQYANEMQDRDRDLQTLRSLPEQLAHQVDQLATHLDALRLFRQRADQKLPILAHEMRRRLEEGAAGLEVKVDKPATKHSPAALEVRRLVGLDAWGDLPRDIRRSYQSMRSYIDGELAIEPEPDAAKARRLASHCHEVRRETDEVELFLSTARRFLNAENLFLALIAAKQRDVEVDDDSGLVFYDDNAKAWRKLLPDGKLFNVNPPKSKRR